jgi:AraC-like DNA-binding protein
VSHALDAFTRTDTRLTVRDVIRRIGLSHRRFIQGFTEEVGTTPKTFYRIQRFHPPVALAQQPGALNWAQLALDCGYFDQPHLIHDFLTFSGLSLADYLLRQDHLRERGVQIKRNHLTAGRVGSIFSNTTACRL